MKNQNRINISIVVYSINFSEIEKLLHTLTKGGYRVTIIDNSPNDELREKVLMFKNLNYIFNNKNLGYGRANNIAIRQSIDSKIEYHLVLNPDIEFETNVLDELVFFMDNNKDVGLTMPNIVYPDLRRQHLCKLLPNPWNLFARRFGIFKQLNKKSNDVFELKNADYNTSFSVPSLSGCFMFMRTNILEKVGGFDDRFFMYCEDIDLSRRIHQVSDTIFLPTAPVIHRHSQASYKFDKMVLYHIKSAIQYFNKWGWFFDIERKKVNKETLRKLNLM